MRLPRVAVLALLSLAACNGALLAPWSSAPDQPAMPGMDTASMYGSYDAYLRGTPEGITQSSSLWSAADGIGFAPDGQHGVAGLVSMACRFDVYTGNIDLDLDPDTNGTEQVDDGTTDDSGNLVVLTSTDRGLQITRFLDWDGNTTTRYAAVGVVDGRFTHDGVVGLQQGSRCAVRWYPSDVTASVGQHCGGLAVAADGRVFVAADGTLKVVTPDGAVTDTGVGADLVAWDPVHSLAFTARNGDMRLLAVHPDGQVAWRHELTSNVTALAALPDRGQAVVGLAPVGTEGGLVVLDGAAGDLAGHADTYEAPNRLYAAQSGGVFAARTAYDTHLLRADR